jgi:hypothetical protein
VTAEAKTKVMGALDPALTYQITSGSLVVGDSLSGSLIRDAGEGVAIYAIRQGTVTAGANYSLTYWGANLSIIYAPVEAGMCLGQPGHAILQPINTDGSSVFKQGSTVPAKFRVCDARGNSVGIAGVVKDFRLVKSSSGVVAQEINEPVDSTTPDSLFRWSATDQQWIFNISTKNLTKNLTYVYTITLNDNTQITFQFGLK